jgi:hypothetical protein
MPHTLWRIQMLLLPFGAPGKFWRGNLHAHSTESDGTRSPAEVCRLYRGAGYDFVSITDHFLEVYGFPVVDTADHRSDGFTTIVGAELHGGRTELGGMWHIVAAGLPLDFAAVRSDTGPDLARRATAAGAFVAVAHPQWYTLTESDISSLESFDAIEVFNGVAADHNDRSDSWHIADIFLSRGLQCGVIAADDYHGFEGRWDFQRGWVWVKSAELSPEALLTALKMGHYYSSTGPKIHHVEISASREVTVSCSPAERVFVTGKGPAVVSLGCRGVTDVSLDLSEFASPYWRVTVRDARGGRAWTNPVWFDDD